MTRMLEALISACIVSASAGAAHAQIAIDKVQPGRLDDQPAAEGGTATPDIAAPAPTVVAPSAPVSGGRVSGIQLEGSTLARSAAEAAMRPYLGSPITAEVLQAIAHAYSVAYARSDIALYSILIPEQTFVGGVVRVVAIENYIDEVILAGDKPETASVTSAYAAAMAADRPLTRKALQRHILLMNDLPGAETKPRVIAGDRADTVKLVLDTKRTPVETVVTLDTRGATRLGRLQLQGDVYLNGWGYEGNQTRLSTAASADFERFLSAAISHQTTFGPSGATVTGSLGYFRTRPDDTPIEGQGYTASLQTSYPLVRSVTSNISVALGIDGLNTDNALVGQTLSSDRTRVLRGAVSASGLRGRTVWATSASISEGLDALGARTSNPDTATTNFTKANFQLALSRTLHPKWRLQATAFAQVSSDRLPNSELMSLGGARFGRAFESGSASGDSGLAGALELTYSPGDAQSQSGSEIYVFADSGKLWLTERPGFIDDSIVMSSAGGGVRINVAPDTLVGFEAAKAIEGGQGDEWRLSFGLGSAF